MNKFRVTSFILILVLLFSQSMNSFAFTYDLVDSDYDDEINWEQVFYGFAAEVGYAIDSDFIVDFIKKNFLDDDYAVEYFGEDYNLDDIAWFFERSKERQLQILEYAKHQGYILEKVDSNGKNQYIATKEFIQLFKQYLDSQSYYYMLYTPSVHKFEDGLNTDYYNDFKNFDFAWNNFRKELSLDSTLTVEGINHYVVIEGYPYSRNDKNLAYFKWLPIEFNLVNSQNGTQVNFDKYKLSVVQPSVYGSSSTIKLDLYNANPSLIRSHYFYYFSTDPSNPYIDGAPYCKYLSPYSSLVFKVDATKGKGWSIKQGIYCVEGDSYLPVFKSQQVMLDFYAKNAPIFKYKDSTWNGEDLIVNVDSDIDFSELNDTMWDIYKNGDWVNMSQLQALFEKALHKFDTLDQTLQNGLLDEDGNAYLEQILEYLRNEVTYSKNLDEIEKLLTEFIQKSDAANVTQINMLNDLLHELQNSSGAGVSDNSVQFHRIEDLLIQIKLLNVSSNSVSVSSNSVLLRVEQLFHELIDYQYKKEINDRELRDILLDIKYSLSSNGIGSNSVNLTTVEDLLRQLINITGNQEDTEFNYSKTLKEILNYVKSGYERQLHYFDPYEFPDYLNYDNTFTQISNKTRLMNFNQLIAYMTDVGQERFPFSISNDIGLILATLYVEPVKPDLTFPINFMGKSTEFTINLDYYDENIRPYISFFILFIFIANLIPISIKLISTFRES